jgi:hypothetical protein
MPEVQGKIGKEGPSKSSSKSDEVHEAMDDIVKAIKTLASIFFNLIKIKENLMKTVMLLVVALTLLVMPCGLFADQEMTTVSKTTKTETVGTISEVKPDSIIIRSETSSSPMNYSYTKSTIYVDETGAPVSMQTVKSGLPVTVFYTKVGDQMIANKVVVRKITTTTEKPAMETKRTSTTTTTTETK